MKLRVAIASAVLLLTAAAVTQQVNLAGSGAGLSLAGNGVISNLFTQQEIDTVMVRISGDDVVVRAEPKNDSKVLVAVGDGTVAWNKGRVGTWYKLKFKHGTVGYVPASKLVPVYAIATDSLKPAKYTVVAGDDDVVISRKLGVRAKALRLENPSITNWNSLKVGTVLKVPTEETSAEAAEVKINVISTSSARVNANGVVIREDATTMSGKVATAQRSDKVFILGRSGAWYSVKTVAGVKGFIRGDYLNELHAETASTRTSHGRAISSAGRFGTEPGYEGVATHIIAEATRHIGTRYRWGGESTSGFDCSGFVRYVFRQTEGITLPRTSREQARFGSPVSPDQLRPGDILSFATSGGSRVSHVGVYIGDNKFVHASSGSGRVRIDTLTGYYAKRFVNARRPIHTVPEVPATPAKKDDTEEEQSPVPPTIEE